MTQYFGIIAGPNETILSALARKLLGDGPMYYLVQFSTLAVLAVAANTSFAGFPRITAIWPKINSCPASFSTLATAWYTTMGFSYLSILTAVLIITFNGSSHALVPLFAVGAFTAFTLSQAGMVIHWFRVKDPGWKIKAFINGIGATITAFTLAVVGMSKFLEGAWISVLVIPGLVYIFLKIRQHYRDVSNQLTMRGLPPSLRPFPKPRVVMPVSGVHRGMVDAVNFARSISDKITAVFIDIDPGPDEEELLRRWNVWFPDIEFVLIPSPYRSISEPLLAFLEQTDLEHNDGQQAVLILPELIPASTWQEYLHNQSAKEIKNSLLYKRRKSRVERIIIDVPYHLKE